MAGFESYCDPDRGQRYCPSGGATPGVFMSGHLRFCFAAVFLAGFSTQPASSNPFDVLFNSAPAEPAAATSPPAEATAATSAPAEDQCLPRPGKSAAGGHHWVYRYDGHRKCWFEADESAMVKKPVHHAAKRHVAASNENELAPPSRKAVVDARDELIISAQAKTPQPTPPAPEIKVTDAATVPIVEGAGLAGSAPVAAEPATARLMPDHPTPDRPAPHHVDMEALLAAAPTASDAVAASAPPVSPVAVRTPEAGDGWGGWTTTAGVILIVLGLVSLLGSSRILRERRPGRTISPSENEAGSHRERRPRGPSFAFARNMFNRPVADELLFKPPTARPAI